MGIQAAYMSVNEEMLDRLVETAPEKLAASLEQFESEGAPTTYIDKMWDGLHFLLTGVSASSPVEDNELSEAIVGVHVFDSEDFIGCTELDELPEIIAALEAVELVDLLGEIDFATFARAEIYPNVWADEPEVLAAELSEAFRTVLAAHRACLASARHLIVSIL